MLRPRACCEDHLLEADYTATMYNKSQSDGQGLQIPVAYNNMLYRLFPTPWWADHLGQHDGSWWLRKIDPGVLHSMPSRQRMGILNAAHDLLKHLGHKLKPFLPEMCALVLTLLQGVSVDALQVKML